MANRDMKTIDVNKIPTKEEFAIGYHNWAMYTGFLGFHKATDEEKIKKYKEFLRNSNENRYRIYFKEWNWVKCQWECSSNITLFELKFHGWEWFGVRKQIA